MTVSSSSEDSHYPAAAVGGLIRQRRRALDMTQEDLATAVGLDTTSDDIQKIEATKDTMPGWMRLLHIADALSMPVGAFFTDADGKTMSEPHMSPVDTSDTSHSPVSPRDDR